MNAKHIEHELTGIDPEISKCDHELRNIKPNAEILLLSTLGKQEDDGQPSKKPKLCD